MPKYLRYFALLGVFYFCPGLFAEPKSLHNLPFPAENARCDKALKMLATNMPATCLVIPDEMVLGGYTTSLCYRRYSNTCFIFFGVEFMRALPDDEDVAAVLSHEMGHVARYMRAMSPRRRFFRKMLHRNTYFLSRQSLADEHRMDVFGAKLLRRSLISSVRLVEILEAIDAAQGGDWELGWRIEELKKFLGLA